MTQDERWQAQYDQMMTFMNENHRRPSKHRLDEHDMLNWYKHVKKAIAKGNYPPHRIEKFALLQQVANRLDNRQLPAWNKRRIQVHV